MTVLKFQMSRRLTYFSDFSLSATVSIGATDVAECEVGTELIDVCPMTMALFIVITDNSDLVFLFLGLEDNPLQNYFKQGQGWVHGRKLP